MLRYASPRLDPRGPATYVLRMVDPNRIPSAPSSVDSQCECGAMRARFAGGHELHPIVRAAAAATPSQWVDAEIVAVDGEVLELRDLFGEQSQRVWHHRDLAAVATPGDVVAYHRQYGVVALGRVWISVRALPLDQAL